jgi:hypothetical protein
VKKLALAAALGAAVCAAAVLVHTGPAAAGSLTVTSPVPWQVIQRRADGRADIVVTGRLSGEPGGVQASWDGGSWTDGTTTAGGRYRVVLRDQPGGQGTLVVRSERTPALTAREPFVGVGDIYVVAGQSNASGRANRYYNDHVPGLRAAEFGNDYVWQDLHDPVDSPVGQVDKVSLDARPGGSVWPLVATRLMLAQHVPVAFVPCALGGTPIRRWMPDAQRDRYGDNLFSSLMRRITAVGARVRAVLWWQGEADARLETPGRVYALRLRRLAAAIWRRRRAPLVVAQIGDYRPWVSPAPAVDAVRTAQEDDWTRSPHIVAGPTLYDVGLGRRVHFVFPDDVAEAAERWAAAILAGVFHDGVPSSPRLCDAVYDGHVTVTLRFSTPHSQLRQGPVGGVSVDAGRRPVRVCSETAAGDDVVITLQRPLQGPLTVSLGDGRASTGRDVPREGSAWALPAESFIHRPVETVRLYRPPDWAWQP